MENLDKILKIRINQELKKKVEKKAFESGTTISEYLRNLIRRQ